VARTRYVDQLKGLRPNNDNVVLAVVGGVPTELVSDEFRGDYDFSKPAEVDAYYDAVLEDTRMQQTPNASAGNGSGQGNLEPSCVAKWADGSVDSARPPRRLVEIARGFGAQSVLASICRDDFGPSTGQIIRAIGEKLTDAARAD
jgi:hypothetical protein